MAFMATQSILGFVLTLALLQSFVYCKDEINPGNSRHLLQSMQSCPTDFSKVDFSSVTSICKQPNYDVNACCSSFRKMACTHKHLVNNFASTCPIEFMAFLNMAGMYPNGIFVGRCTSGSSLC